MNAVSASHDTHLLKIDNKVRKIVSAALVVWVVVSCPRRRMIYNVPLSADKDVIKTENDDDELCGTLYVDS